MEFISISGAKRKAVDTKGKKGKRLKVAAVDDDGEEEESESEYDSSVSLLISFSSPTQVLNMACVTFLCDEWQFCNPKNVGYVICSSS